MIKIVCLVNTSREKNEEKLYFSKIYSVSDWLTLAQSFYSYKTIKKVFSLLVDCESHMLSVSTSMSICLSRVFLQVSRSRATFGGPLLNR